jgi:arylsulfatase A-like enzyme
MNQPNIVVIVLDAVRRDHTSVYDYERPTTPNLEAIAKTGTVYKNAFANSNWTGTSHGTLFTGRMPSDTGVHGGNQELPDQHPTLPEKLTTAGYRTYGMSAGAHIRSERGYERGFQTFKETYRIRPSNDVFSGLINDSAIRRQTLYSILNGSDEKTLFKFESLKNWIDGGERPFFAFINVKTAHHPYNPPRPHKSRFCPKLRRPRYQFMEELFGDEYSERQFLEGTNWDRLQQLSHQYPVISGEFEPTQEEWDIIQSWYDGAIHYLDRRIGEFVDWLESRGELNNTHLIITSDHGEYFGEHGLEKHYYGLYEPVLHIPLIISGPDTGEGNSISSIVSLADLYPTVSELATGESTDLPHSSSLAPFEEESIHNQIFAELGSVAPDGILRHHPTFDDSDFGIPTQVVRDNQYKFISKADGSTELYNWRQDPAEESDLSDSHPDTVEKLKSIVETELRQLSEEPLSEEIKDDQLQEHLEDLGYM